MASPYPAPRDVRIAIICALKLEYDAVRLVFDHIWEGDKTQDGYGYSTGRIGGHVSLLVSCEAGKASAAGVASSIRSKYRGIKLAIVAGICGGVPGVGTGQELVLGDVVISTSIFQYDYGRRNTDGFRPKEGIQDALPAPGPEVSSFVRMRQTNDAHRNLQSETNRTLQVIQQRELVTYDRPEDTEDYLYEADYVHKHRNSPQCGCDEFGVCDEALEATCEGLGCEDSFLVQRPRKKRKLQGGESSSTADSSGECIRVWFGVVGSGDTVMKSGRDRDEMAKRHSLIALEMEGAGVRKHINDSIVIKSVCDYSDSHKNKSWQNFAAAAAASATKTILERFTYEMELDGPRAHLKRPVDDMLSPSTEKRARLARLSPDSGQSQAGDDPALRNPSLYDEMNTIKKQLIRRLYFSKIDERLTHLAPAQGTTCRWFLTDSKYRSWQDVAQQSEHGGFLWIKGNPGTGKSTLMKHLFEETRIRSRNDPSKIALSFFFLARGTAEEKTTAGLYRSLLHQLFEIASDLKESLEWMTLDGARSVERNGWSEEALKQTLKHAVPKLGNRALKMFVDALDECDTNKAADMVSFFEELCDCAAETRVQLHICFSSRYYPTVVIKKGLEVCLEDENGHTEDIRKYIKSRLRLDPKSKHSEALCSEILEKSSGIFLWVVLVLGILNNETSISIRKLREHLEKIPPGLNELFQMILTRDGVNLQQLQLCLNWILFASRPLKPQELYFAIQLGFDKECLAFWEATDLDVGDVNAFVRRSSKGLAEVTGKPSQVQFIHESVRDFLLREYRNQWSGTSENLEGNGHQVLRDRCLAQLNALIKQQNDVPNPLAWATKAGQLRDAVGLKFPFFDYAVQNVLYHSDLAQRNGIDQRQFLFDFPLQGWVPLNNFLEQDGIRKYTDSVSLLYIFGERNLADLIRIHARNKSCFHLEAERCGAPILAALANDNREAVQEFLRAQTENEPATSPLHGFCPRWYYEPHKNNRSFPFNRNFIFKRREAFQVLHDLVLGNEEIVALTFVLSPHRRDEPLDSSDPLFLKLLSPAIRMDHRYLLENLLQRSAHVGQKEERLDSLLLEAVKRGRGAIVKMLLDRGADMQRSCREAYEPLVFIAAWSGHAAVVKVLLDEGAEINSRNDDGETFLSAMLRGGKPDILKILLERGADTELRDENGQTPLSWAAQNIFYWREMAEILLDEGADVDSKDKDGGRRYHGLLENKDGRTPLSWAAGQGGFTAVVVGLLLEKGADADSKDKDGRTPLSWAAAHFDRGAAKLLLEKGADVGSKDKDGRTPLLWALSNKGNIRDKTDIVTLLRRAAANSR